MIHSAEMEASEVLEASKKLDKEYAGLVSKYSEQLIQIYRKTGQQEEYKKELIYQIFSCRQDNLENVKLLKAMCDEKEWCTYREQILNSDLKVQLKLIGLRITYPPKIFYHTYIFFKLKE